MKHLKIALESGVAGIVLTLASGLVSSTIPGASWFGWPLTWVRHLVLGPEYAGLASWPVDWIGLVGDIIIWSVVAFVIYYLIHKSMGSQAAAKSPSPKPKRKR